MFGIMNVTPITNLHNASPQVRESLEQAVARLLEVTEHPAITKCLRSTGSLGLPFGRYTGDCQACRRCIRDHEGYGMHHHSIDKPEHNSEEIEIQHLI